MEPTDAQVEAAARELAWRDSSPLTNRHRDNVRAALSAALAAAPGEAGEEPNSTENAKMVKAWLARYRQVTVPYAGWTTVCCACGALVVDNLAHDAFHARPAPVHAQVEEGRG